jgi:hypothetical protein
MHTIAAWMFGAQLVVAAAQVLYERVPGRDGAS